MKALITGGSGYFGSLFLQKLTKQGIDCRIFDLNDINERLSNVEFFQGDIRNYFSVANACKGIDVVYHNVAQVPLAKDKALFHSVNVTGTENILKAAKAASVKKVVYTSSSAVFGIPATNPVTEEMQPYPMEAYGRSKYEGEQLCQRFVEQGLDVSIIRPRTIMGHGRLGIFQVLFEWIYQGTNIPVLNNGANVYQFVHADDLAEACLLASQRSGANVFNCGAEEYGTMKEVLENLCEFAGTGSRVKNVPMGPAVTCMKVTSKIGLLPLGAYHSLMYGRSMYFDNSKIKKELRWKPQYSNDQMFIESYKWYLKNRSKVLKVKRGSHHRIALKPGILKLASWFL
tara:strand:- start:1736 stop:2764 length:1029 start_codon:yes stop_codon:yes gene_type:complete